jgi:23S rRNA G2069 N7-methylase RlmK/C1962 C5-methylase RlmI
VRSFISTDFPEQGGGDYGQTARHFNRAFAQRAQIRDSATDALRLVDADGDGFRDLVIDDFAGRWLVQSRGESEPPELAAIRALRPAPRSVYWKKLAHEKEPPVWIAGEKLGAPFEILENGLRYWIDFQAGYSQGIFLDQRDNRARLREIITSRLKARVAPDNQTTKQHGRPERSEAQRNEVEGSHEPPKVPDVIPQVAQGADSHSARRDSSGGPSTALRSARDDARCELSKQPVTLLNTFAYTCAFGVAGAAAGAATVNLDLSKRCLDWGRRNYELNGIDPAAHDFIFGDVFDWLRRLAKKQRRFDIIVLDPPTFSRDERGRVFTVGKNFGELVRLAVALLAPGGVLLCSTNQRGLFPGQFRALIESGLPDPRAWRFDFQPMPSDFTGNQYLKSCWVTP